MSIDGSPLYEQSGRLLLSSLAYFGRDGPTGTRSSGSESRAAEVRAPESLILSRLPARGDFGILPAMLYVLLALLSAALFGAASPLSKPLLSSFGTFQLAGLLYLGAALGASVIAFRRRYFTLPWRMDHRNQIRLGGAILFGGVLAPLLLLLGLRAASAASVSLWLPLELVTTAVLGRLFFREHLGSLGMAGMAGVLAAGILLSLGEGMAGLAAGLLVMGACVCWGFDNNFTALIDGITPAQSTFWKGLVAGLANLTIGLLTQGYSGTAEATFAALGVGVFSYGASIVLYITAAQNIGATRGQMFFASSPFFGVVISALFLGESISVIQIAAGAILAVSLVLVFRDRHEHEHHHDELEHDHSHRHDDAYHGHEHRDGLSGRHTHRHRHEETRHQHPHLPDLHHRHDH
jgi:drug/metabolite transporter (DMT)-like permease